MKYYSYDVIREYGELFGISNISMQNTASRSSYYVDSDGFRYQIEYISTPNGSEVEVWNYIDDVSESYKQDSEAYHESLYDADMEYEATRKYNCHSYAWYDNTSDNPYWMNSPDVYYDQTDSSYMEVTSGIRPGDIICYYNTFGVNLHSGIVTYVENNSVTNNYNSLSLIEVQSKWGTEGVYNHRGDICPYTNLNPQYSSLPEAGRLALFTAYIKFYRPRVESAHQLNSEMDDLSLAKSVSGNNGIQNTYSMYELNIGSTGYYEFTVSSDSDMNIVLYDDRMQQYCTLNYTEYSNIYTFALNLTSGRYYLRSEYTDSNHSGTISVGIKYHVDHVYNYTSVDTTYHIGECVHCGHETGNTLHKWRDYSHTHMVCEDCNQLKRRPTEGFIPIIKGITPDTETE